MSREVERIDKGVRWLLFALGAIILTIGISLFVFRLDFSDSLIDTSISIGPIIIVGAVMLIVSAVNRRWTSKDPVARDSRYCPRCGYTMAEDLRTRFCRRCGYSIEIRG